MQQQNLVASKAIVIHKIRQVGLQSLQELDSSSYNAQSTVALTVHDIKQTDKEPVMGVGQLFSEADKQELKDYLNGEHSIRDCWLPENLMMMNSSQMVWYVPAKKREMYFRKGDKPFSLNVAFPSLIFRFSGGSLSVAAYVGRGRPKLTQKLYHAPLWNIYQNTRLCTGTADTTNIIGIEAMKVWEDAVFETVFSHSNHPHVIARHTKSKKYAEVSDPQYLRFIKSKAKSGETIKANDMVPLGVTLEAWAGGKNGQY